MQVGGLARTWPHLHLPGGCSLLCMIASPVDGVACALPSLNPAPPRLHGAGRAGTASTARTCATGVVTGIGFQRYSPSPTFNALNGGEHGTAEACTLPRISAPIDLPSAAASNLCLCEAMDSVDCTPARAPVDGTHPRGAGLCNCKRKCWPACFPCSHARPEPQLRAAQAVPGAWVRACRPSGTRRSCCARERRVLANARGSNSLRGVSQTSRWPGSRRRLALVQCRPPPPVKKARGWGDPHFKVRGWAGLHARNWEPQFWAASANR